MGLPCPYVLLEPPKKDKKKRREREESEEDDAMEAERKIAVEAGDRVGIPIAVGRRPVEVEEEFRGVSMEDWEALLLEIARRSAQERIGPQVHIPVPAEIVQRAIGQGSNRFPLSLWVAVVAALLAVGAAGGPAAMSSLPGFVGGIMSSARTQGRGGFHVDAASELQMLFEGGVLRRELESGAGDFFPGILG